VHGASVAAAVDLTIVLDAFAAVPRDRRNMPTIKKGTKIERSDMIFPHMRFSC
jgi:hypothetical protein